MMNEKVYEDAIKYFDSLIEFKNSGASLRQLERLTGIGKGIIHRL